MFQEMSQDTPYKFDKILKIPFRIVFICCIRGTAGCANKYIR